MKRFALFALALLASCSKKQEEFSAPAASSMATASAMASAAPNAIPPEEATPFDPSWAPGAGPAASATTPTDPNTPPSHAEHEQAAAAEIHKGNYKKELEQLEKEDLSADRK
jgi:hypothetical protein